MIIILAAAVILIIGICVRKIVRKDGILRTVTYRSQFGYTLSMTADGERTTVTYADDGKEPVVKDTDGSCYTNIVGILETYDFPSWKDLSDKEAGTDGYGALEIVYDNGKTYFFSLSQSLPEKARGIFSAVNTCLLEYAGIIK